MSSHRRSGQRWGNCKERRRRRPSQVFQYAVFKASATPILDLDQAPPEPSMAWLPKLIGLLLGLVVGAILILADRDQLPQWHWPPFNALLFVPALYVAIAFHEIGHFVAGKLVGLEAGGISVGAFVFTKSGKNWVFRFDWRMWTCGFFKPLSGTVDFHPSRYAWFVAGGPLASIGLTVLCGLICVQYGSGNWDWIGSLFWTSLFTVIFSAIPYSAGLNKSDGGQLWQLIRHPERSRCWIALLTLQTEEAKGLRPHEWNPQSFEQILTIDASANEYLYCQLLAFYRRLDESMEAGALEHLENALARSAPGGSSLRHALFLEAASASAIIRKEAAQARTWRDRACKLQKPQSLNVVDAGIAMCEGRYEEAVQHWEAAQANVARRRLDSGIIRFAKEKWAEYEAACRTARG